MRLYRVFRTKEERANWEKFEKKNNETFKVCFRIGGNQVAHEFPLTEEQKRIYKYATVYTVD